MSQLSTCVPVTVGQRRIGRDLWPAGRVARAMAGVVFLTASAATAATAVHDGRAVMPLAVQAALAFGVITAAYMLLVWALGERLLARIGPWLAALVLVAPLAVMSVLPFMPEPAGIGADFYLAVSLLVQAVIGYGGCETAGIPALVLRRRYTVYCVLNSVDVAERRLRTRPSWVTWTVAVLVLVLTMALSGLALTVANGAGFWAAYLLFLLTGYTASKIRAAHRHAGQT